LVIGHEVRLSTSESTKNGKENLEFEKALLHKGIATSKNPNIERMLAN